MRNTGRIGSLLALLTLLFVQVSAQSIDKIVAVVGEDVILKSELEAQIQYLKANNQPDDGSLYCRVMEEKIFEKLLLNKARQDSIEVSDDQVDGELERKLAYFIQGYGGIDKLEEIYGKPLIEIKADLRPEIKDQLLVERMRQKVINSVVITPREVKKFYGEIPKDSLPLLPAEVELYHLAIKPTASLKSKREAKEELKEIRTKILAKEETFEDMAKRYSRDYGTARVGGDLGVFGRGKMVPAFEEIAFKAEVGSISKVFESPFGYHIMYVYNRVGEEVSAKHILIPADIKADDNAKAMERLKEVRTWITEGDTLEFEAAAMKYSDDPASNIYGGAIKNPQTGETRIPIDLLDADFFFKVDNLKVGEVSDPMEWSTTGQDKFFHILFLKKRIAPHVASLDTDYYKLQAAALQAKQAGELDRWIKKAITNIYIDIKDEDCIGTLSHLQPLGSK